MEWINVLAILLSPLIAVQVTQWLNKEKEAKARRVEVFGKLMATRATATSPIHVEALNRIDIEFYTKNNKYKSVLDSWKFYQDHLGDPAGKDIDNEHAIKIWAEKSPHLLTDLLYEMSKSLGYNFDKVTIRRGHYFPKGLGDLVDDHFVIRRGLAEVFLSNKPFPVAGIIQLIPPSVPSQNSQNDTNHC